jgi:hypothetical protein
LRRVTQDGKALAREAARDRAAGRLAGADDQCNFRFSHWRHV